MTGERLELEDRVVHRYLANVDNEGPRKTTREEEEVNGSQ
jgi:hypothetical protein